MRPDAARPMTTEQSDVAAALGIAAPESIGGADTAALGGGGLAYAPNSGALVAALSGEALAGTLGGGVLAAAPNGGMLATALDGRALVAAPDAIGGALAAALGGGALAAPGAVGGGARRYCVEAAAVVVAPSGGAVTAAPGTVGGGTRRCRGGVGVAHIDAAASVGTAALSVPCVAENQPLTHERLRDLVPGGAALPSSNQLGKRVRENCRKCDDGAYIM